MYCHQGRTVKPSEDAYCSIAHREDENTFGPLRWNFAVLFLLWFYICSLRLEPAVHQLQCEGLSWGGGGVCDNEELVLVPSGRGSPHLSTKRNLRGYKMKRKGWNCTITSGWGQGHLTVVLLLLCGNFLRMNHCSFIMTAYFLICLSPI